MGMLEEVTCNTPDGVPGKKDGNKPLMEMQS